MDKLILYQRLEDRMKRLAEAEGDIYVPNIEPLIPVHYVLICMEPSLSGLTKEQMVSRIQRGYRNFLHSIEDFIMHFCARQYLCGPGESYHITDISKGAMTVKRAHDERTQRYDRWFSLLEEEINIIAHPHAKLVAVGKQVATELKARKIKRTLTEVIHFSGQAAKARNEGIKGKEAAFHSFTDSFTADEVVHSAQKVLNESGIPAEFRDKAMSRFKNGWLTPLSCKAPVPLPGSVQPGWLQ